MRSIELRRGMHPEEVEQSLEIVLPTPTHISSQSIQFRLNSGALLTFGPEGLERWSFRSGSEIRRQRH